jgi:putative ABC transport system substrate-binding protein
LSGVVALAASLALASLGFEARSAEPIPKIGFLGLDSAMQGVRVAAFRDQLAALGYVEGRNIIIDYRWAEGRFDQLPQLATELVADKVNMIVTSALPATLAAKRTTTTIPIVATMHDPVGFGLAQSLARPAGNITGVAYQDAELSAKRLSLLRDLVPGLQRVAVLWNALGNTDTVQAVESAARALGLETRSFEVHDVSEFPTAIKSAKAWGAQGLTEVVSPFFTLNHKLLIAELAANRMPATCELREYVVDGCLMTYSADLNAMFGQMASFVARILKGAKPGDLAIEQPSKFTLIVNLKTAKALGLTIPPTLLLRADEVIQ